MEKLKEFETKVLKLMNLNENKKNVNDFGCVMLYVVFPEFKTIQKKIDEEDLYIDPNDDSFGLEKDPHCTILYGLLESVKDEKVRSCLYGFRFVHVKLNKMSLFENDKYDVLKFEVEKNGSLVDANDELSELPNENEFKKYNPHLTVAYLKPGKGDKYLKMFKDKNGYVLEPTKIVYSKVDGSEINLPIL